jgi:ABC-type branched-subunit amino acid transport system substrate-binding protein
LSGRRAVALLVLSCILSAACGARFSARERAALKATGSRRAAPVVNRAGNDAPTGATASDADTGSGAATGFSDSPSAADGPGASAQPGQSAAAKCTPSGGATDVGVTADSVTIGNVSIISGPVPGFGRTSQAAVQAYVNYANSKGGVCGRRLKLTTSDDRFDSGGNRAETDKLSKKVFGFVGGLSVVDDGGATVLQGTNIPDVGLALSDPRIKLTNGFSSAPIDLADGGNGFVPALQYYKSQGAVNGAVVWPGQAIARERAQGYVRDMQRAGLNVVYTAEVSVTETNYNGHAAKIQQNHVDVLVTALEVTGMASLAKALKQQGYQPKFSAYGPQAYGKQFLKLSGDAAEGVTLNVAYDIFEDRAQNPAIDTMLTWFARTNPGLDPDYFAIIAWTAADLFTRALAAAGPRPTRDGVLAELRKVNQFDAGGILAPNDPAGKHWARCFLIIKVQDLKWRRADPPASGYRCP